MLLRSRATLSLATALAFVGPAGANDSSSELAAGGTGAGQDRGDLHAAGGPHPVPSEVRVRYEMRNDTGQPVTLRVAFSMPEVPSDTRPE